MFVSARRDGIGGNSSEVPASLTWTPPVCGEGGPGDGTHGRVLCGKVVEVLFDCHGSFGGFVLDACCERRLIESHERSVADLVLRACNDNRTVCVTLCASRSQIESLAIRT